MSNIFSWGSNKDREGQVLNVNSRDAYPPHSATDSDMKNLLLVCPNLEFVNCYGCTNITAAGVKCLYALPKLRSVNVYNCPQFANASDSC